MNIIIVPEYTMALSRYSCVDDQSTNPMLVRDVNPKDADIYLFSYRGPKSLAPGFYCYQAELQKLKART